MGGFELPRMGGWVYKFHGSSCVSTQISSTPEIWPEIMRLYRRKKGQGIKFAWKPGVTWYLGIHLWWWNTGGIIVCDYIFFHGWVFKSKLVLNGWVLKKIHECLLIDQIRQWLETVWWRKSNYFKKISCPLSASKFLVTPFSVIFYSSI